MTSASDPDDEKGVIPEADRRALKERLNKLGAELEDVEAESRPQSGQDTRGAAMGMAFRLSIEMAVGFGAGGLLGYALDQWWGTRPFALIVCLLLGTAAGIMNAVRTAQQMQRKQGDK